MKIKVEEYICASCGKKISKDKVFVHIGSFQVKDAKVVCSRKCYSAYYSKSRFKKNSKKSK